MLLDWYACRFEQSDDLWSVTVEQAFRFHERFSGSFAVSIHSISGSLQTSYFVNKSRHRGTVVGLALGSAKV